ncbi:sirohydrochlorin chelatase [Kitasatospora griseola]|uniref:sirohydrochlorin chelatase n=1 Tax=Kitasatospora griseola TaxID=2064 RepID=UPI0007C791C1|nr:sirohydrochlorin chelatase [Kitasatospora griseola]
MLLAVAHGSRDAVSSAAIRGLIRRVRALRPEVEVQCCFLDRNLPPISEALSQLRGENPILVPLLLSTGYHVRVDIPAAVAAAGLPPSQVARALGPHPLLAEALAARLAETGASPEAPVVLAGAGSSDPTAVADTTRMAHLLARHLGRPVTPAHLSATGPTPHEAVAALRAAGHHDVAVATYLLAPGFFARRAATTEARWTSPPLAAHDAIARLILHRYDEALSFPCWTGGAGYLVRTGVGGSAATGRRWSR